METNLYTKTRWVDKFVYTEPTDQHDEERVDQIVRMMPSGVRSVLDIGVGGGYIYRRIKGLDGVRVCGIDISLELIRKVGMQGVCVADIKGLPFPDKSFDVVIVADVLEHLGDESFRLGVREIQRVSREYIIINSPYEDLISWPVALCNKCSKEFNIYGHLRSINRGALRAAFPMGEFRVLSERVMGRKRAAWSPTLAFLARRIGRVHSTEAAVCPYCLNSTITSPRRTTLQRLASKVLCGMLSLVDRVTPFFCKSGSEICILFRRVGHA